MTIAPRHVIFGTGAIGLATLDALRRRGETARLVNRSGHARVPDDVEVVAGDARDPTFTTAVARGAAVAALTDDRERIEPYYGHARDGFDLSVHVTDDAEADRAIRGPAGSRTLHVHHHGHRRRSDLHLQRPTG